MKIALESATALVDQLGISEQRQKLFETDVMDPVFEKVKQVQTKQDVDGLFPKLVTDTISFCDNERELLYFGMVLGGIEETLNDSAVKNGINNSPDKAQFMKDMFGVSANKTELKVSQLDDEHPIPTLDENGLDEDGYRILTDEDVIPEQVTAQIAELREKGPIWVGIKQNVPL